MSATDHLEKTLSDHYRKEIDQEENVWRSLPFFAATLALQLAAVLGLAEKLPPLGGSYFWWISVPIGMAAMATLATLLFMAAAIAPARFRYIAPEPALREYALRLVEAEIAHPEIGVVARVENVATGSPQPGTTSAVHGDALSVFKNELALQHALATHHNRLIDQRRAKLRSIAGLCMLASVLATLVLVGVTTHHHMVLDHAAGTLRSFSGEREHGTQTGRQGQRVPDVRPDGRAAGRDGPPLRRAPAEPSEDPGDARGGQGVVDEHRASGTGSRVREGRPGEREP